ncbi:MAG: hypothetical protein PVH87_21880 [Desulfobacteraceae bacterium]|jgi:hypothetical protein
MDVLVFANPVDVSKERFFQKISKVPALSPKFVLEHGRFKSLLMQRALGRRVIVFFAYDQDDLTMALSLKEYLAGTRVIMVLHKVDAETVKQGLSISPCFMTHAKSDFSDIIAVLEKISTLEKQD